MIQETELVELGKVAVRKTMIPLAGLVVMAGCTTTTEKLAEHEGVRVPAPDSEQVFHCQDKFNLNREDRRTFAITEGGRLRIEVRTDDKEMWIEKSANDLGIDVYERANWDDGHGIWHAEYEIENLDEVRRLVPGARAKGHIDYTRADRSIRWSFVADISQPTTIKHKTLGEIQTIQIRNLKWHWNPKDRAWKDENYPDWNDVLLGKSTLITYVDTATWMIVRYQAVNSLGRQITCEWTGTN